MTHESGGRIPYFGYLGKIRKVGAGIYTSSDRQTNLAPDCPAELACKTAEKGAALEGDFVNSKFSSKMLPYILVAQRYVSSAFFPHAWRCFEFWGLFIEGSTGWVFVIVPNWNAHFGNVTGTVIQVPTRRFVGFWFLVEDDER